MKKFTFQIEHLPKDIWKDHILPMDYTTSSYYDVSICKEADGFTACFQKRAFEAPVTHSAAEYDFPDKLYQDFWENAYAWGVVQEGKLIAAIETCPEEWSNRLRVTELWVDESIRRKGVGHALMALAKEQARRERRRAILLETQSCNTAAIAFYLQEGFTLIGFDACCYANNDLARREVRLELGLLFQKPPKPDPGSIAIRKETPADYYQTELMTQRAFWNLHRPGCDEHLLVRKLRQDKAYLPELSRVAELNGKVVGCIMYSRSCLQNTGKKHDIITFGPLCVDPDYQGMGIGKLLVKETVRLAAAAGFPGIVIFGEPDYYPKLGFTTCDRFGITTADGRNFDAFMGLELAKDALSAIGGSFHEAEVFETLTEEETEALNREFPFLEKQRFPGQWV